VRESCVPGRGDFLEREPQLFPNHEWLKKERLRALLATFYIQIMKKLSHQMGDIHQIR
jgi:hypothetical protein